MKTVLRLTLLTLACLFCLAGCGQEEEVALTPAQEIVQAEVLAQCPQAEELTFALEQEVDGVTYLGVTYRDGDKAPWLALGALQNDALIGYSSSPNDETLDVSYSESVTDSGQYIAYGYVNGMGSQLTFLYPTHVPVVLDLAEGQKFFLQVAYDIAEYCDQVALS